MYLNSMTSSWLITAVSLDRSPRRARDIREGVDRIYFWPDPVMSINPILRMVRPSLAWLMKAFWIHTWHNTLART
jgi:hypothetical protein